MQFRMNPLIERPAVAPWPVIGDTLVIGDAWVSGHALVNGHAEVTGHTWVSGEADVSGVTRLESGWFTGGMITEPPGPVRRTITTVRSALKL